MEVQFVKTNLGYVGLYYDQSCLHKTTAPLPKPLKQKQSAPIPKWLTKLKGQIVAHFSGKPQNFGRTPLHLNGMTEFQVMVSKTLMNIKSGRTCSYGELAELSGHPGAARAVGSVMKKNPFPVVVPCHRVLASGGKPGGYSGAGGMTMKTKLLKLEGIEL